VPARRLQSSRAAKCVPKLQTGQQTLAPIASCVEPEGQQLVWLPSTNTGRRCAAMQRLPKKPGPRVFWFAWS
jgi:hypothetical protein